MDMNTCIIQEYKIEMLGVSCPGFEFHKNLYEEDIQKLDPILKEAYFPKLNEASKYLKEIESSTEKLVPITIIYDIMSLCELLSYEKRELLLLICFNLLIRLALNGCIEAMDCITTSSFVPEKENISKIIVIDGIENLDYIQMIENLFQKLMERERRDAFIEVIKDIRMKYWSGQPPSIKRVRSSTDLEIEIKKQKF